MAQPAPEPTPDQKPRLRVSRRTYSDDANPLVEVLLLLYDWSIERHARQRNAAQTVAKTVTRQDGDEVLG